MKKTCLFIALLVAVSVSGQNNSTAPCWHLQQDEVYHFSFFYPDDWTLKLPGTNTRFFVTSPVETDNDMFRENVNLLVRKAGAGETSVKTAEADIRSTLSANLKNFKVIRSVYLKWNNLETYNIEYTCTQSSEGKDYNLHMNQWITISKGNLFVFTFTAEADAYATYFPTIERIFQSLILK